MAEKKPPTFRETFVPSAKAQSEARRIAGRDLDERLASKIILNPDDVAGELDFSRGLTTMLGGIRRAITLEDLRHFQHLIRKWGNKFKGGITAKQVIDLSVRDRRERAHEQITMAAPITHRNGRVKFQTNSGPKSQVARHYQEVEFLNYPAVLAASVPANKIVSEMLKGKVRIECSCEDWRFKGYRFMATVGRYNAGRPETGMSKITNPSLQGAACKHLIRVMTLITQSPTFKNYAVNMIQQGRMKLDGKKENAKLADMQEFTEKLQRENYRQRRISTTDEKRTERGRWKRPVIDLVKKAAEATERARQREVKKSQKAIELHFANLVKNGGLSKSQAAAALAAMKGAT